MKMNLMAISVMSLAISVFVSALIISDSIETNDHSLYNFVEQDNKKQLLTKDEISAYLGITTQQFDELDKAQIVSVGQGIPFLNSGNEEYYTIQGIEQWLTDINYYQTKDVSDY